MGAPAARITDVTTHGGLITGPGNPTVLIGNLPAASLGDDHTCPMATPATPPIPHVGGSIIPTSASVFIGGKPALKQGDTCICCGPPANIMTGAINVMIG